MINEGALKGAYLAYDKWLEQNETESKLPGLKYNDKKLFWISAARMFCLKSRNNVDPAKNKILQAFRNIEAFSKDFDCPLNSAMNPTRKCNFW